jgi:2,4-dienoyl-CoA reductase-like NADH-dependent reductase (Old Yellow Enzyme family)
MTDLFTPLQLGAVTAPNRIVMAPLTRGRATREAVPTAIMADYYAQRAGAGLIISEATGISREGLGWPFAPGLWTQAQVEGWKPVTEAVHRAGGRIFAQLWHMGRIVHPDFLGRRGTSLRLRHHRARQGAHLCRQAALCGGAGAAARRDTAASSTAMERAARNALAAGFDGVQIHAANGYLIDQYLRDSSNLRGDA